MNMTRALSDVPAIDRGVLWRHFGDEPMGWDLGDDGDGDGAPGKLLIKTALQTFADCWGSYDLDTAARVFNLPVSLIADTVVAAPLEQDPFNVNLSDLGSTIQVLCGCRSHFGDVDVATIAKLLNMPWTRVVEAVGRHPWMFISGHGDDAQKLVIEHDGE